MQSCKLDHYGLKRKWQKHKPELRFMRRKQRPEVPLKTLTMVDIAADDSRYPVITKKQKYLVQNEKSSAATQFQARSRVNRFSTTSN